MPRFHSDLTEGRGAEFVDRSVVVLIFLSDGYFHSKNCVRELLRAVMLQKPLIVLGEAESFHGGLTLEQVTEQLDAAATRLEYWGLRDEMVKWLENDQSLLDMPTAGILLDSLLGAPTLEWNRTPPRSELATWAADANAPL